MTPWKNPFSGIKLVYRRSSTLTKVVVLAVVVLSIVALLTLRGALIRTRESTQSLAGQAAELEQENSRLEQYIERYGTIQGIIQIAKEKLGLVEPDSVIIQPE